MKKFREFITHKSKFYAGILFIITSFLVGKITQFTFFAYFQNQTIRWISILFYSISWIILTIGVWWVGKESSDAIRRYFSYRFYHESAIKGTKHAIKTTKKLQKKVTKQGKEIIEKGKINSKKLQEHVSTKGKKVIEKSKENASKIRNKIKKKSLQ